MKDINEMLSLDPLTEREIEILKLLEKGLSNREIGEDLHLALETIRWYTKRIYSKLQVSNRTQAVVTAREQGLFAFNRPDRVETEISLVRHNLPAQSTSFIGRSSEINEISTLLAREQTRLVTILGAGGMGKTRLALQLAKNRIPHYPDGVFFVSLEHLISPEQTAKAITKTLGMELTGTSNSDDQLAAYLSGKNLLLLLDNFESVLAAAEWISRVLEKSPGLQVIATSRQRLNLRGEILYRLDGLGFSAEGADEQINTSDSVRLFIQTARQVQPGLVYDPQDMVHVAKICRKVEGMPLAVILAASWAEVLSPSDIESQISQSLDLLETEAADVPERQRSIRALFENLLALLRPEERAVFLKLAVFQEGCRLSAAAAVAGASIKQLASFSGKSLLHFDQVQKRYHMHPLLRQYASETLEKNGKLSAIRRAHRTYMISWLKTQEKLLRGGDQVKALDAIEQDFQNILAAWSWAVEDGDHDAINMMLENVYWFCTMRDRVPEGAALFQAARDRFLDEMEFETFSHRLRLLLRFDAGSLDYHEQLEYALGMEFDGNNMRDRAFLLWALGVNGYTMREYTRAIQSLENSLSIFEKIGDDFYTVETLHLLWMCSWFVGKHEVSRSYFHQALDLARRTHNQIAVARALAGAGAFQLTTGDFDGAERSTQEALAVREYLRDRSGIAMSLANLGWLAAIRGDLPEGRRLAKSGHALARAIHNQNSLTTAGNTLGWIAALEGDYEQAITLTQKNQERSPDPTVKVVAGLVLAFANCGLEKYDAASIYLKETITFCLASESTGILMMCMPVAAVITAQNEQGEMAVELLALCKNFPKEKNLWRQYWSPFRGLQERLEKKFTNHEYQLAWQRGARRQLIETAREFVEGAQAKSE